jgi:aspartyl-tRNA(Asn)/glutamyl-tRNA(Gln) amidotransferase subunit A
MASEINSLSALELVAAFKARRLSPVEVLDASLDRLAETQPAINAFCFVDEATGQRMARESEARWMRGEPLGAIDGVPVAVKDANNVAGWPTRFGSLTTSSDLLPADTFAVARLREAGAVFFGKTTTPEFGWKGLTDSQITGITRNPHDTSRTPGGSSGGSSAAVAVGIAPLATGGDGGGSVRIPAAFTGVYGLKPTYGLVPNITRALGGMAVFGGLTRTVADTALMLRVVARPDQRDPFAVPHRDIDYLALIDGGVKGLNVGYSRDLGFPVVDPDVARLVESAVAVLKQAGAEIVEVDLDLSDIRAPMGVIWRTAHQAWLKDLTAAQLQMIEPDLLDIVVSARDISAPRLQWALDEQRRLSVRMQEFHARFDLLLTPTMPTSAFAAGVNTPDRKRFPEWFDWSPFTWPFNMSRQPAASVPCGMTAEGLPVGLQIIGAPFGEDLILRASRVVEQALPQPMPTMKAFPLA